MQKVFSLAFTLAVLTLGVSHSRGQSPGTYSPGQGLGGTTRMLRIKSIQDELKATPEQAQKLDDLSVELEKLRKEGISPRAWLTAYRKRLAEILRPEQVKRFEQIQIQQMGTVAFKANDVQLALKLTEHQKARLEAIDREKKASLSGNARNNGKDRRAEIAGRLAVEAEALVKSVAELTDEQKATWKELYGQPFVIVVE